MNATAELLLLRLATFGQTEPDESVAAGRQALDHWWRYPWYDSQTDGIRRIEVSEPWEWDWSWLNWLPQFAFNFPTSWLQWTAWTVTALLLAGLVYLLVRALLRRRQGRSEEDGPEPTTAAEDDQQHRVDALPISGRRGRADLLGEARRFYQSGNYAQAIIYLFSYQLLQLDKHQVIRLAKGKTNRQYLREIGPRRDLHAIVEQTMIVFEDVFFGRRAIDQAKLDTCWSNLDRFEVVVAR